MNAADPNSHEQFFCLVGDRVHGPFNLTELAAELRYGHIKPETPVRRESETVWVAFRERSEFAMAVGMPVEIIAQRLEAKGLGSSGSSRSLVPTPGVVMAFAVFFACVLAFSFAKPSLEPLAMRSPAQMTLLSPGLPDEAPTAWSKTMENGFSAECPVRLQRIPAVQPGVISYRGMESTAGFGVDLTSVSASYTAEEYQFELSKAESGLLGEPHTNVSSSIEVALNGYHGHDVLFTHLEYGMRFSCGARFLGGGGKLAVAWVTAKSATFAPQDIDRFLKSFELQ